MVHHLMQAYINAHMVVPYTNYKLVFTLSLKMQLKLQKTPPKGYWSTNEGKTVPNSAGKQW